MRGTSGPIWKGQPMPREAAGCPSARRGAGPSRWQDRQARPPYRRRHVRRAHHGRPPGRHEAPVNEFCRDRDPRAPFGILIRIAATCLHPGADQFKPRRWRAHGHDDEAMRAFKAVLRAAVSDPGQVPGAGLSRHVRYHDGSPGAFLRRLWRDLYGDEPPAAPDRLFAPGLELRELDTSELLVMVAWATGGSSPSVRFRSLSWESRGSWPTAAGRWWRWPGSWPRSGRLESGPTLSG
jgi:hypothetical protein